MYSWKSCRYNLCEKSNRKIFLVENGGINIGQPFISKVVSAICATLRVTYLHYNTSAFLH